MVAPSPDFRRDVDELQRIKLVPKSCETNRDCPDGSRCDGDSAVCTWECLSDSECGADGACDQLGRCGRAFLALRANDTPGCQGIPKATRFDAVMKVHDDLDHPIKCASDDDKCPCGTFCGADNFCHVDCMVPDIGTDPTSDGDLTCGDGLVCKPLGKCEEASHDTPPRRLTLGISPDAVTANTIAGPVVVPITVSVTSDSLDFITPNHLAVVLYHFVELDDPQQAPAPGEPVPQVRCTATGAFANSCEINGDWTFTVSGSLQSQPRTIWVQLPQTTTEKAWTLEAGSRWALAPRSTTVKAEPVAIPTVDTGHYAGTIAWPNGSGQLQVAVEAMVSASGITLYEPTRALLPDGNVALARNAAKSTMLSWLTSTVGSAHYDVRLDLGAVTYDATTGHLGTSVTLFTGAITQDGAPTAAAWTLSLDRADAPSCTTSTDCAVNRFCETTAKLCLPGSGPTVAGAIVDRGGALPTSALASAQIAAWKAPLDSVVAANPVQLGGAGLSGLQQAYCYQTSTQQVGSVFATMSALKQPSWDLACRLANNAQEYPQPTFGYVNHQHEDFPADDQSGNVVHLLDACLTDLGAQPTTPFTADHLLAAKSCVSLSRFLLALRQPQSSDIGARTAIQLLRQWLGVNAYVANTTVQEQQHIDVLAASSDPAQVRLGNAVDLVEQNLRILLDPSARSNYIAGTELALFNEAEPDYRILQRPLVRWTFNNQLISEPDAEGTGMTFTASGVDLSHSNILAANVAGPARVCDSAQSFGVSDPRRYSIQGQVKFAAANATFILLDVMGLNAPFVEATYRPTTDKLSLVMKDRAGNTATFPDIARDSQGGWGLLTFVADHGVYRLHQAVPGGAPVLTLMASSVVGGGPRWDNPGALRVACDLPGGRQSCTSWDLNVAGDAGDIQFQPVSHELGPLVVRQCMRKCVRTPPNPPECSTSCQGSPPGIDCTNRANNRYNELFPTIAPNAPGAATAPFKVTGTPVNQVFQDGVPKQYQCDTKIDHFPFPGTRIKPVCPSAPSITWDELSLWDRAVQPEEVVNMASRFNFEAQKDTLPARNTAPLPRNGQDTGLAVYLVEAAAADLNLLSSYLAVERNLIYPDCSRGVHSDALDRALARAGRNLRTVAVLADEAAVLASAPDAAGSEWLQRYEASLDVLLSRRAKALEGLKLAMRCINPLGISEDDLPMYTGEALGANNRFFASSHFLAGLAQREIDRATTDLTGARNAFNAQQQSEFQETSANTNTDDRIRNLRVTYQSALRRYCGAPAVDDGAQGQQKLLDDFLAGRIKETTCFVRIELPECQNATDLPVSKVPPQCLRGEMGERILALQSANVDAENAKSTWERSIQEYDSDTAYCTSRNADVVANNVVLARHLDTMKALRREAQLHDGIMSGLKVVASLTAKEPNFVGALGALQEVDQREMQDREKDAEDAYKLEAAAEAAALELKDCYHKAFNEFFSVMNAFDVKQRAFVQAAAAAATFAADVDLVRAVAAEAGGQLTIENTIERTPPHLHYWLDESIANFQREMSYARRLTYLALRAFEYENQASIGFRGDVLAARIPSELAVVVSAIDRGGAPLQGSAGGIVVGQAAPVFSLRDEFLRLQGLVTGTTPQPGDPPVLDAKVLFSKLVSSEASKVYDKNHPGVLLGHGIRFSITPAPWNNTFCAERIWRITPSAQTKSGIQHHNLVLYQENAFSSQLCRKPPETMQFARTQPSHNLLVDDAQVAFDPPDSYSAINIDWDVNKTAADLSALQEGSNPGSTFAPGFAGRGLYGNYILLFPLCDASNHCGQDDGWSQFYLEQTTDVLLRFDFVDATNAGPPGP